MAVVLGAALLVGCGGGGGPAGVESTPAISLTADDTAVAQSTVVAAVSETAVPDVGGEVTPSEIALGGVIVSLSLQPARHLVDQATVQTADLAQQQQALEARKVASVGAEGTSAPQVVQTAVVLAGMARATNNFDPSQTAPPDTVDTRIRHAVVKVRTKDGSQPVPYLTMTMDVLLDGRPIGFEQSVLPMAPADTDATELYYGNNVRFGPKGTYQLFVRMQRSPFLGKDQPQAALFNVVLR